MPYTIEVSGVSEINDDLALMFSYDPVEKWKSNRILHFQLSTAKKYLHQWVLVDSDFTHFNHVDCVVPEAYSCIAFLECYMGDFKDSYSRKLLFDFLVRSKLEYSSAIVVIPHTLTELSE